MTILHSLRFRLILVLVLVTLVPVATVSILMLQATDHTPLLQHTPDRADRAGS